MGATRIALVVGGALLGAGCFFFPDDDSSSSCDSIKAELGSCGSASAIVVPSEFFGLAATSHQTGFNVFWLTQPDSGGLYSLQIARFDENGSPIGTVTKLREEANQFLLRSSVRMGASTVFSINRPVTQGVPTQPSEIFVIDGDGTKRSIDVEPLGLVSVALVPITETELGLVAIGSDGANAWLSYRSVDIATETIGPEVKMPEIVPAFPAVPDYSYIDSISAIGANDGIYVAWVTTQRTAIRLAKLDLTGQLVQGPVDVTVRTGGGLYVPQLAALASGDIALTWTGAEGVEVRVRQVPADITGVKSTSGGIVNSKNHRQEHARIAAMPGGGAMLVWAYEDVGAQVNELRSVTLGASLRRCAKTKEIELSCQLGGDDPRASVVAARENGDVLVAWYDWASGNIQTRFVKHPGL